MEDNNQKNLVDEFIDFFASAPTLEDIVDCTIPDELQKRVKELQDKSQNQKLSDVEQAELEGFRFLQRILSLIKARAYIRLKKQ